MRGPFDVMVRGGFPGSLGLGLVVVFPISRVGTWMIGFSLLEALVGDLPPSFDIYQ